MVLMVLDHVRAYFGNSDLDPTNLAVTTPAAFFTRWVTHFCAPTFVLLAGVSAFLWGRNRTLGEQSRHLLTRGLMLIILEQTWVNVTMFFTYPQALLGTVLWAIGWSMISLAVLIHLPRTMVGVIGLGVIGGHNLFDGVQVQGKYLSALWDLLHVSGFRSIGGLPILLLYPLVPWIGLMACGYAMGPLFTKPSEQRQPILQMLGWSTISGFLILRWLNVYGDPDPWTPQASTLGTVMAFLNCQKYPPSLLFLLMTIGPALLALTVLDGGLGRAGQPLLVFGRSPLFFYLLQWPLVHSLAVIVAWFQGFPIDWLFRFLADSPDGYGNSLAVTYLFWVIAIALLYWPCVCYANWRRPA